MALKSIILVLLAAMVLCGVCCGAGAVYKVGGSDGWIVPVDYNQWSAAKEFHVGDTLLFSYNNQFHNVMQVTEQDYNSCNPSSAMATYSSGSDKITLERPGHYYFLCGAPGHCQAGQKVDIEVNLPHSVLSPSPAPYGLSAPSTPPPVESSFPSPSLAPSGLSSPSIPHPVERPPSSAAVTNAPKLASATLGFVLVLSKFMF
ncbi:hypothetical protein M0R45_000423 [Rubus argutus]|uniref:Phytocyanin domain-containing protein n=1 Tax=Rubus argutus TaxID=59490 RepID=A0AAW1VLM0_RUBAR